VLQGTMRAFAKGCYALSDGTVIEINARQLTECRTTLHKSVQKFTFDKLPNYDLLEEAGAELLPSSSVCPVRILCDDCVDAAINLMNQSAAAGHPERATILDMASCTEPGGSYETGYGTQEQSLFWRSNLWAYFDTPKGTPNKLYPIQDGCALYARNVLFIRGNEAMQGFAFMEPREIDIIAMGALQFPQLGKDNDGFDMYTDAKEKERMLNIIRTIMQACVQNGSRILVLGAFGCGTYKNPPIGVAELFREALTEYGSYFTNVVFALRKNAKPYGVGNYETFRKILDGFVPITKNPPKPKPKPKPAVNVSIAGRPIPAEASKPAVNVSIAGRPVAPPASSKPPDAGSSSGRPPSSTSSTAAKLTGLAGRPVAPPASSKPPSAGSSAGRPPSSTSSTAAKLTGLAGRPVAPPASSKPPDSNAKPAVNVSIAGRPTAPPPSSKPPSATGKPLPSSPNSPRKADNVAAAVSAAGRPLPTRSTAPSKPTENAPAKSKEHSRTKSKAGKTKAAADTEENAAEPEHVETPEESIRSNYLPDLSSMMRVSLSVSYIGKDKDREKDADNPDYFSQEVSPRGHYLNQKKQECLVFFNPDFEALHKTIRCLLQYLLDNHSWRVGSKPSKKVLEQADSYRPDGQMRTMVDIPSSAKEGSRKRQVLILAALCQNLKTCMHDYGDVIDRVHVQLQPPIAYEIDRDLENPGRMIKVSEFVQIESAFGNVMESQSSQRDKVDRLLETMNDHKNRILCGPLLERRIKTCFLLYRTSEYLRPFEEELELKDLETLQSMHRLRTRLSFDLIEHSFLFVQNNCPLFDIVVDRFKMLKSTETETFFYLEATIAKKYIKCLHEAIDMKMKNILDDYSPEMITPEEFVSFANTEGKGMKASNEQQIEELNSRIQDMQSEAKNCMYQFGLEMTQQAVSLLSDVLIPDEKKLVEEIAFAGIDVIKKIRDFVTGNEEQIEEKGVSLDCFQHLIRRQDLLRKVHYSKLILQKMKGKSAELVKFLLMVRLYNLLTNRRFDVRTDYIGLLIDQRINPVTEFVEFFVRPLDKITQTPEKST